MLNALVLAFLSCSQSPQVASVQDQEPKGWRECIIPDGCNLEGISFADSLRGWAVGNAGLILATLDGGKTWQKARHGIAEDDLRGISVLKSGVGLAVGGRVHTDRAARPNAPPIILRTNDSGKTWRRIQVDIDLDWFRGYRDVHWVDANTAFVLGSRLLVTHDAGLSWNEIGTKLVHRAVFVSATLGWYVDISGLYMTSDGGVSWVEVPTPKASVGKIESDQGFERVMVNSDGKIWLSTGFARTRSLLQGERSGDKWTRIGAFPDRYVGQFCMFEKGYSWCVVDRGEGRILLYESGDGGRTWLENSRWKGTAKALAFSDSHRGWLCTDRGIIRYSDLD